MIDSPAPKLKFAMSPLERLNWIGQVQGDTEMADADVATAALIARFIMNKTGYAARGGAVYARLLGITRRAWVDRIGRLERRGHVLVTPKGPAPAWISAVIWPDCITEHEKPGCPTSFGKDGQPGFSASDTNDGKPHFSSSGEQRHFPTSEPKGGKRQRQMLRSDASVKQPKTESYVAENQGITGEFPEMVEFCVAESRRKSSCEDVGAAVKFYGPSEGDELLIDEGEPSGEPPALDIRGIESLAAIEASRAEPSGWRDYADRHVIPDAIAAAGDDGARLSARATELSFDEFEEEPLDEGELARQIEKERREEARDAEIERGRRYAPIDPYCDDDIPF